MKLINYVSNDQNERDVQREVKRMPEELWIRWCDRLESIGKSGIVALYKTTLSKNMPLDRPGQTPRPKTPDDVWSYVT